MYCVRVMVAGLTLCASWQVTRKLEELASAAQTRSVDDRLVGIMESLVEKSASAEKSMELCMGVLARIATVFEHDAGIGQFRGGERAAAAARDAGA